MHQIDHAIYKVEGNNNTKIGDEQNNNKVKEEVTFSKDIKYCKI